MMIMITIKYISTADSIIHFSTKNCIINGDSVFWFGAITMFQKIGDKCNKTKVVKHKNSMQKTNY